MIAPDFDFSRLSPERARAVVDACGRLLPGNPADFMTVPEHDYVRDLCERWPHAITIRQIIHDHAAHGRDWRESTPLAIGTRLLSIAGECDNDGEQDRETWPNAIGVVERVYFHATGEPYYSTTFEPSGVWVMLDHREIENPAEYRVLS